MSNIVLPVILSVIDQPFSCYNLSQRTPPLSSLRRVYFIFFAIHLLSKVLFRGAKIDFFKRRVKREERRVRPNGFLREESFKRREKREERRVAMRTKFIACRGAPYHLTFIFYLKSPQCHSTQSLKMKNEE